MNKIALCTLATNRKYLEGAKCLYESYLKTRMDYDFFIMVWLTTDTTGYENLPLKVVPHIIDKKKVDMYPPADVFSKINAWLFTDYDFIIFLDADCFFRPIDATLTIDNLYNYAKGYDLVTLHYDPEYTHEIGYMPYHLLPAEHFALKPNTDTFMKLLLAIDYSYDDENLFYNAWANDLIKVRPMEWIDDRHNAEHHSLIANGTVLHLTNNYFTPEYKMKYWECEEGMKRYKEIIEKNLV